MHRNTEGGTVYRSRHAAELTSVTNWRIAVGMIAPYIVVAVMLFFCLGFA